MDHTYARPSASYEFCFLDRFGGLSDRCAEHIWFVVLDPFLIIQLKKHFRDEKVL